jgi:hypothetical protein
MRKLNRKWVSRAWIVPREVTITQMEIGKPLGFNFFYENVGEEPALLSLFKFVEAYVLEILRRLPK